MAITQLSCGPVHTLVANQQYATPTRRCILRAQPFANIQISNDGTTWLLPIFDAAGQGEIAGAFIRDTTGGAQVRFLAV